MTTDPEDIAEEPVETITLPLDPPEDAALRSDTMPESPADSDAPLVIFTDPPLAASNIADPAVTNTLPAVSPVPADSDMSPPTPDDEADPTLSRIDPEDAAADLPVRTDKSPLEPSAPS